MRHPLEIREEAHHALISGANERLGVNTMKVMIIVMGLVLIGLALYIDNPLALAGILAWVILP